MNIEKNESLVYLSIQTQDENGQWYTLDEYKRFDLKDEESLRQELNVLRSINRFYPALKYRLVELRVIG